MKKSLVLFILIVSHFSAFCQYEDVKSMYKDLVDNPDIIWIVQKKSHINLPNELNDFVQKMKMDVEEGKIEVYDEAGDIISNIEIYKSSNRSDTLITLNPLSLESNYSYAYYKNVDSNLISFCEVWYFDDKTKQLKSNINFLSPKYYVFDQDNLFIGFGSFYRKINEDSLTINLSKIKINREIYLDSIDYGDLQIKLLFNEYLGDIIINYIDYFTVIDSLGKKLKHNNDAIYSSFTFLVYDPITLQPKKNSLQYKLISRFIKYYEIEEEWIVDYTTFNISKRILKLTPVIENFPKQKWWLAKTFYHYL